MAFHFCSKCGGSLWLTGDAFPDIGVFRGTLDQPNRVHSTDRNANQIFLDDAMPSGKVMAGVESFRKHKRGRDGDPSLGTTYDHH